MLGELRGEVLRGERMEAIRPGHWRYRQGPAVIRFIEQGGRLRDDMYPPVPVMITEVEQLTASGTVKAYHDTLRRLGQPPIFGDDVTRVAWTLA